MKQQPKSKVLALLMALLLAFQLLPMGVARADTPGRDLLETGASHPYFVFHDSVGNPTAYPSQDENWNLSDPQPPSPFNSAVTVDRYDPATDAWESMTLTVGSDGSTLVFPKPITAKSKLDLSFAFHVARPTGTTFEDGDYLTLPIPTGLNFAATGGSGLSGNLGISGVSVPWTIDATTGAFKIVLNGTLATALNGKNTIWGKINLKGEFRYLDESGAGSTTTEFNLGSEVVHIDRVSIDDDPSKPPDSILSKTFKEYDGATNAITWEIKITPPGTAGSTEYDNFSYKGYTLKDEIKNGHTYNAGSFARNGSTVADTGAGLTVSTTAPHLTFTFPDDAMGPQTITYKTTPTFSTNSGSTNTNVNSNNFSNTASLYKKYFKIGSDASANFDMKDFFGKTGVEVVEADNGNRYVKWEVKVKAPKTPDGEVNFPNVRIIDTLPSGGTPHTFYSGNTVTKKSDGSAVDTRIKITGPNISGTQVPESGIGKGQYQISDSTLTYQFNDDVVKSSTSTSSTWTLTYWTEVNKDAAPNDNGAVSVKNGARLEWGGGSGGTGPWYGASLGIGKEVFQANAQIAKSVENSEETFKFDIVGNFINWTITINNRGRDMSGTNSFTVTDAIQNTADHLLVITGAKKLTVTNVTQNKTNTYSDFGSTSAPDGPPSETLGALSGVSGGGFTYTFANIGSDKYTITFSTQLTDTARDDLYKNGKTDLASSPFKNRATLTGGALSADGLTVNVSKTYDAQMLNKAVKGTYNYTDNTAEWTLTINRNRHPLKGVTIEETLPAGMTLKVGDKSDFTVVSVDGTATATDKKSLDEHHIGLTYDPATRKFILTLPDTPVTEAGKQYVITYQTKIDSDTQFKSNGEKAFPNTAYLKTPGKTDITGTDTLRFTYSIIKKSHDVTDSTPREIIHWSVNLNPGKIDLPNGKIHDLLAVGLALVPGTIKLYNANVATNGTLMKNGAAITLPEDSITLISSGNQTGFDLKLPAGRNAYILEFETTVNKDITGLTNTIELWGSETTKIEEDKTTGVDVKDVYSRANSGIAQLTIKKIGHDKNALTADQNKPLPNISFELWTSLARFKQGYQTGPDGTVHITELPTWILYAKEVGDVPKGYLVKTALQGGLRPNNSTGDDKAVIEVINEVGYAPVQITKVGAGNILLSGGKFVLEGVEDVASPLVARSYAYNKNDPTSSTALVGTNAGGTISFGELRKGTYYISEIEAPEGHVLTHNMIRVVVDYNSDKTALNVTYTLVNKDKIDFGTPGSTGTLVNVPDPTGENQSEPLSFTKISSDGTPLAGATFALRKQSPNDLVATATSGTNGIVTFNGIPIGDYYIYETTTPNDYLNPNAAPSTNPILRVNVSYNSTHTALKVEIQAESGAPADAFNAIARTFKNTPAVGNVTFTKKDSANDAVKINGGTFVIEGTSLGGQSVSIEAHAVDNVVTFVNVPVGNNYTIKETVPPSGYFLTTKTLTGIKVEYTNGDRTAVADVDLTTDPNSILTNDLIPYVPGEGKATVTKVDADGKVLAGATFTLYDSNGKAVASMTTGADGLATFTKLKPYSSYTIKETAAPTGYDLSSEVLTVTTKDRSVLTFTMVNKKTEVKLGSASILKTDADGKKLPGATFTLYDGDGKTVATAVTGSDGLAVFKDLVPGKAYTVKETMAPIGYQLSSEVLTLNVTPGAALSFTVLNKRLDEAGKGDVRILKTDAEGAALGGATFTLYDAEGRAVASATSGADGGVTFSGIPANASYTIKETAAPSGYLLSGEVLSIQLTAGQVATYTVVNRKSDVPGTTPVLGSLSIMKVNSAKAPLAGAEFTVYDADGKVYASTVTGADGIARFTGLPLGRYAVIETRAPQGYRLYTGTHAVTLTETSLNLSFTLRNASDSEKPETAGWEEIDETPVPGGPGTPGSTPVTPNGNLPKTGEIPMSFYLLLVGLSLLGAGLVTALPRKKGRKHLDHSKKN